jgi:hypothetical protein
VWQWQWHRWCRAKENSLFSLQQQCRGLSPMPTQGVPSVSFYHNSALSGTYTSVAVAVLKPCPYLAPFCGAIEGTAAPDSVTHLHFTPSGMGWPPPRVFIFVKDTAICVFCVSFIITEEAPTFMGAPQSQQSYRQEGKYDDDDDNLRIDIPSKYDADVDYISITSARRTVAFPTGAFMNGMQRGRHTVFMKRW